MPKVLFAASVYSHLSNFHRPYLQWFRDRGWEVHIACAAIPAEADLPCDRMIPVTFEKRMSSPENFRAAAALRRTVRREGYDLIACHTSLAAFFTRLAVKGLKGRPRVLNMVHGYLFDDHTPAHKRALLLGAEKLTAPETDWLLTMNRWDFELAAREKLGRHVAAIPGVGVDFGPIDAAAAEEGAALRRELGLAPEAFLLVYAAEFSPRKSQQVLIRAMAELPDRVVLALPGSGETFEDCRALAARLELENRVIFPGQVRNMPVWYRAANAAVSASRSEGLPFNLMEAMRAGLPVVASAVKGHTDLIEHETTGLLYLYGDAAGCASQLRRLLAAPEKAEALAARAKNAAAAYGLDRVFGPVTELYAAAAGLETAAATENGTAVPLTEG